MPSPESRSYYAEPQVQHLPSAFVEAEPRSVFGPPVADTYVEYPLLTNKEPELPQEAQQLQALTTYFDKNYAKEGLPKNWWELNKIGFSMKSQMNLLTGLDEEHVRLWNTRAKTDMLGFCLEYLAEGRLIYPVDYTITTQPDGSKKLVDQKYEKSLVDTATTQERNGSVVDSLHHISDYLVADSTAVGASATMLSPEGKSGLKMDTGADIEYPDSYLFTFLKTAPDTIKGFGFRTDLSKQECREVIAILTGKTLSPAAPEEEYVRAISCLPGYGTGTEPLHDIVDTIHTARKHSGTHDSRFAYQHVTWDTVHADIDKMDDLYRFDEETNRYLTAFTALTEHQAKTGTLDPLTAKKQLAATVLELCKLYEERKLWQKESTAKQRPTTVYAYGDGQTDTVAIVRSHRSPLSYGQAYEETAQRPGCAGGGGRKGIVSTIESVVPRLGVAGGAAAAGQEEETWSYHTADCVACGSKNVDCGPCNICKVCESKM